MSSALRCTERGIRDQRPLILAVGQLERSVNKMRLVLFIALLIVPSVAAAQISVPRSESPEGHFVVMIETDKDQAGYEMDSAPKMWIEDVKSKRKLIEFTFGADPSSDAQPLRSHTKVLWNAGGDAVAIQFQERHYSHLSVYRLKGSLAVPESFVACQLPDDGEIIRKLVPRFKEFRSRWFQHPDAWIDGHTLLFTAGAGAILEPKAEPSQDGDDVNFMAGYRFYVDYRDPETPIVRRIEYATEN